MAFQCAACGREHEGLPDLGFRWPDSYFDIPESERASRIRGTTDICVIDESDYFIRGVILVPILDSLEQFGIGVWVSQKRENFETYLQSFDTSGIGPFFGWLCNRIPCYEPGTWALKTMAHFQGNGKRPLIEIEPSDHPLYRDFSQGIELDHAWRIVHHQEGLSGT